MTRSRLVLIVLIPIEIAILYWLGSTFYRYPHRLFTYRSHEIYGWIWQDVPIRIDGSWQFSEAGDRLVCKWDLALNNYSYSDTVRVYQVIYAFKSRAGTELVRRRQTAHMTEERGDPPQPYLVIAPTNTAHLHYTFSIDNDNAILVAHAYISLSAERIEPRR